MFAANRQPVPVEHEEGSVSLPVVQFAATPEGFTDLQSRFVDAFIQMGGKGELAAIEAGYAPAGAEGIAIRNLANPKINAEIVRRLKLQQGTALAIALGGLFRIIETSKDDKAVVQAALGIADRFGLAPPKGPAVAVQVNNVGADAVQSIIAQVWESRQQRLTQEGRP